jgi:hypothetical protein
MSREIVQVGFHKVLNIVEGVRHSPLKRGANIFKAKWELAISECTPWADESRLMLVGWVDLNLVVTRKSIHE